MTGPTLYTTVYGDRVGPILEGAKSAIINAKEELHRRFHDVLCRVAEEAYAHGIRDGFAQGVAAESESRLKGERA